MSSGVHRVVLVRIPGADHVIAKDSEGDFAFAQGAQHDCRSGFRPESPRAPRPVDSEFAAGAGPWTRRFWVSVGEKEDLLVLRGAVGFGAGEDLGLEIMQDGPVAQNKGDDGGFLAAPLFKVDSERPAASRTRARITGSMLACPRTTRDMVAALTLASFASSRYDVFFNVRSLMENPYREHGTGSSSAVHLPGTIYQASPLRSRSRLHKASFAVDAASRVDASGPPSKSELEGQLYRTGWRPRAGDSSEGRIGDSGVRVIELRVVERIEELAAQLEAEVLQLSTRWAPRSTLKVPGPIRSSRPSCSSRRARRSWCSYAAPDRSSRPQAAAASASVARGTTRRTVVPPPGVASKRNVAPMPEARSRIASTPWW